MFNLNKTQLGLLAEVVKDIGFAVFGVFGLPSIDKILKNTALTMPDFAMLAMGAVLFLILLGLSLTIVKDVEDDNDPDGGGN